MDYEKKYKDAMGMAEEIIRYYKEHNRGGETSIEDLEQIFPELKENEDERIRKRIIQALHGDVLDVEETTKAIAWLEKQVPVDEEKVLIGARKDVALSIMNFIDKNTLGMCLSNMECADLEDAVVNSDWLRLYRHMKKKLEKQDEKEQSKLN